ncbi:MAG: 50S ribosomal protein L6 [Fimbriimonadaceae bacterium]|jgi:large subunit ribosomal protein L6|nr:50S ribosomal protein L6 [Fimbriimonadaceae bacterium]
MSRIGLKPIKVPANVTVSVEDSVVKVKGPKGELAQPIARELTLTQEEGNLSLGRPNNQRRNRSQHGLARTLLNNMVVGVTDGHSKTLQIVGVGYRASMEGKNLLLNLGYSHPVRIEAPEGITFEIVSDEKTRQTSINVKGIDKAQVGQIAADIRKVRKPDPYKGKGVRYKGEIVKTRPGKRAGK